MSDGYTCIWTRWSHASVPHLFHCQTIMNTHTAVMFLERLSIYVIFVSVTQCNYISFMFSYPVEFGTMDI
jgi:hypothetical protein